MKTFLKNTQHSLLVMKSMEHNTTVSCMFIVPFLGRTVFVVIVQLNTV